MIGTGGKVRVSIVAVPEAMISTLTGIYDVLSSFGLLAGVSDGLPEVPPFAVEIVGPRRAPVMLASGLSLEVHRSFAEVEQTDIVVLPSLLVAAGDWRTGRHPELVGWLMSVHAAGAILCSACSGVLLLAETGLLDGKETTIHWIYARAFRKAFPAVRLQPERVLVATGERTQFVMSGASTSWHDLVLYLVARHAGPTAAQAVARFFALRWHQEGLAPHVVFDAPTDHGDAVVAAAQRWLGDHFSLGAPVDEMVRRSGLPERSFKRRFTKATGLAPIDYVQHLRVEDAKRRLERSASPIEEIG